MRLSQAASPLSQQLLTQFNPFLINEIGVEQAYRSTTFVKNLKILIVLSFTHCILVRLATILQLYPAGQLHNASSYPSFFRVAVKLRWIFEEFVSSKNWILLNRICLVQETCFFTWSTLTLSCIITMTRTCLCLIQLFFIRKLYNSALYDVKNKKLLKSSLNLLKVKIRTLLFFHRKSQLIKIRTLYFETLCNFCS